jgi:hypothetical protein
MKLRDFGELLWIQARATNQHPINIWTGHDFFDQSGLD